MILIPNSNSEDARPLAEFNPCHGPDDGRFCSTATTRVGITSYTSKKEKGEVGYRSVNQVLGVDRREFADQLRALPGVSHVSVEKGTGAFQQNKEKPEEKAWEPTWIVGYKGNGAARRLIGETAKRYDQDAVLFMHRPARGKGQGDPAVELHFPEAVSHADRKTVSDLMRVAGFGGWTWGTRGGATVLRCVHVPEWSEFTADQHRTLMAKISHDAAALGFTNTTRTKYVKTEVVNKAEYDRVIGGE